MSRRWRSNASACHALKPASIPTVSACTAPWPSPISLPGAMMRRCHGRKRQCASSPNFITAACRGGKQRARWRPRDAKEPWHSCVRSLIRPCGCPTSMIVPYQATGRLRPDGPRACDWPACRNDAGCPSAPPSQCFPAMFTADQGPVRSPIYPWAGLRNSTTRSRLRCLLFRALQRQAAARDSQGFLEPIVRPGRKTTSPYTRRGDAITALLWR